MNNQIDFMRIFFRVKVDNLHRDRTRSFPTVNYSKYRKNERFPAKVWPALVMAEPIRALQMALLIFDRFRVTFFMLCVCVFFCNMIDRDVFWKVIKGKTVFGKSLMFSCVILSDVFWLYDYWLYFWRCFWIILWNLLWFRMKNLYI